LLSQFPKSGKAADGSSSATKIGFAARQASFFKIKFEKEA